MATVVQSIIQPDESAIKAHLETLFAPCREQYPDGLIELRYGVQRPDRHSYFFVTERGIEVAAAFAAQKSREGANVYVGVNPRKPDTPHSSAGADRDVEIAFWHFADLDAEDAVDAAGQRLRALPPTVSVTTGTKPHRRPHFYWLLDEPSRNMAAWTHAQRGIAQSLDGDAVINPSRIMRLAGTVNFPPQHKLQRGYTVELSSIRTEWNDERPPVMPEEIALAYPYKGDTQLVGNSEQLPALVTGQTTLSAMRSTRVGDLIDACTSGDSWHNAMIRLVAHMASIGRTSAEIIALADHITLPGYSVDQTRREMATALNGARLKWALPEPADDVAQEEATRESADSVFDLLDLDQIESMEPPRWIIRDMIAEESLSIIYGDPGAGKSFVALDLGLRLANGMDWHGVESAQTGVLYIAGEGKGGIGKRIKGWRREHGYEGQDAPFLLLPVAVQLLDKPQLDKLTRTIDAAIARANFPIGVIVIDTVSRAISGADENGQDTMSAFVAACDAIKSHAGAAVIGIHHSGKDKDRGMRGSTVLLGACDASFRVSKDEFTALVTIKTEKQKDAEEAAPIYVELKKVTWAAGLEDEITTLVPFRSEAPTEQQMENLNSDQIARAFGLLTDAWAAGRPLSLAPQSRAAGRYAPEVLNNRLKGKAGTWKTAIEGWLMNDHLSVEMVNTDTKMRGIRVLNPILGD